MFVIKRDGSKAPFDGRKIVNAINGAFLEVDGQIYETDTAEDIAIAIEKEIRRSPILVGVETIQDWVEEYLMRSERKDVARSYIRYRYKKEVARKSKDDFFKAIGEKLAAVNVQNNNANVDEASFGGRIGEASSVMTRQYALDYLVSKMARDNHLNNEVYIHDLDSYAVGSHNCLSIPFDKLLNKGFNTRQADIRPANSVNTAFQLVAVIFQLQSLQQFGGVSATHLDWTMVPFVRKSFYKHYIKGWKYFSDAKTPSGIIEICSLGIDNVSITNDLYTKTQYSNFPQELQDKIYNYALEATVDEINQAIEAMYHNLNTLQSRSGNQLPFTSINYGTCTLPEGRMIIKGLIEGSIKGVGKFHKTSIFPCGIFQIMKGVNKEPGTPNYDLKRLALESTALRLYPNYANVDWSGNAGYDVNDPRTYFSTINKTVA